MTSKLKCPFCQTELEDAGIHSPELYFCCTNCYMKQKEKDDNYTASPRIWQALIQAKQDLEFFKEEQDRAATALIERTKELDKCQKDLEKARYAITDVFSYVKEHEKDIGGCAVNIVITLGIALTQIEHKE